jgi:hypothetical protein
VHRDVYIPFCAYKPKIANRALRQQRKQEEALTFHYSQGSSAGGFCLFCFFQTMIGFVLYILTLSTSAPQPSLTSICPHFSCPLPWGRFAHLCVYLVGSQSNCIMVLAALQILTEQGSVLKRTSTTGFSTQAECRQHTAARRGLLGENPAKTHHWPRKG